VKVYAAVKPGLFRNALQFLEEVPLWSAVSILENELNIGEPLAALRNGSRQPVWNRNFAFLAILWFPMPFSLFDYSNRLDLRGVINIRIASVGDFSVALTCANKELQTKNCHRKRSSAVDAV
jgi:hypothetical protein